MTVARVLGCVVDAAPCPLESQTWVPLVETLDWTALGITPAEILYAFTWGAGSVLSLWAIGYAVGCAVAVIRRG